MYMCVYMNVGAPVCVCVCARVHTHIYVCECGSQRLTSNVFLAHSPPYELRQVHLNPELADSGIPSSLRLLCSDYGQVTIPTLILTIV